MIFRIALAAPFTLIFGIIKISSFSDYNSTLLFPVAFSIALVIIFSVILIIFLMPKYKVMQTYTDELNNSVRNQLTGIRVVRAFNAQSFEKNKFGEINDKSTKLNIFTNTFMGITFPIILTVMNLMTLSLY
jgi:ATP-binding cassette subfamily B protein